MLILILSLLVIELLFIKIPKGIYLIPIIDLGLFICSFYYFVTKYPNLFIIFLIYFLFFKLFIAFRVFVKGRNPDYLRRVTFRSALVLDVFFILDIVFIYLSKNTSSTRILLFLFATGILFCIYVSYRTLRSKSLIRNFKNQDKYSQKDLPTISVLIPARNETDDLIRCLESVIDSNYPKMEVIVLDDCSTNGKTPDIIRSFAQKGIKFISGTEPEKEWTAKNWAYQQLIEASSGEYLIFLGVDVIVNPEAFNLLISTLIINKKKMISLIPINVYKKFDVKYYFNQPMRYFIELILPNRLLKTAPALSTLWVVNRNAFNKLGGMKSVKRTVIPEKYFARELNKKDLYIFAASDQILGIYSDKSMLDQKETSKRLTYPTLRKRPEYIAIFIILFSLTTLMPIIAIILGIVIGNIYLILISALNIILLTISIARVNYLTYRKLGVIDYLMVPFSLLYTVGIAFRSMYDYEYSEVTWKERNVCIPVMLKYIK